MTYIYCVYDKPVTEEEEVSLTIVGVIEDDILSWRYEIILSSVEQLIPLYERNQKRICKSLALANTTQGIILLHTHVYVKRNS